MDWTLADNGTDDIINSRDMYMRMDELDKLESDRDDATAEYEEALEEFNAATDGFRNHNALDVIRERMKDAQDAFGDDEKAELEILKAAEREIDGFMHGVTLIADTYFKQYAKQYAEDMGRIDDDAKWPATCIDWDQAAEELQSDFSQVEIDGNTYYYS